MMQAHDQETTPVAWTAAADYTLDAWQRGILFLDVLRQRGNQYFEHMAKQAPNVLHFHARLVLDGRDAAAPGQLCAGRDHAAAGRRDRPAKKRPFVVVDPRAGHGPGIGGFKADSEIGVAMAAGPRLLLRGLPAGAGAGADDRGHHAGAGRVPRAGDRAAPRGRRQAGGGRQLPGRLGDDAGGGDPAGVVRPADHRRRALVLLGRRARQEPDALFGRPQRRQLADGAGGRPRRRHLRRRRPGPELREHEPGQHALVQAVQPVRQGRQRGPALSRVREMVGRPCPDERRGDAVDRRQSVRRQQAGHGRDRHAATACASTCATSPRRSSASAPRATTSRRRSRRWAGSWTSTAASTTSAPTARPSSTASTNRSGTWASSSPAAWRRRSIRSSPATSTSSTACRPASTRPC